MLTHVMNVEELKKIDDWDLLNFDKPFNFKVYMPYNNFNFIENTFKIK